mgnify:CR=1 FL=1
MYEEVFGKFAKIGSKYYPVMAVYKHVMLDDSRLLNITKLILCDEYWTFHSRDLTSELYNIMDIGSIYTARSLYETYLEMKTGERRFVIKKVLVDKCHDYLVDKVESDTNILLGKCKAYKGRFCKYPKYEQTLELVTKDYNTMDFRLINIISSKDEFL